MTVSLHGIRVLDLSRVLAGPLCGMILGDLGADVLKVERPGTGDESRGWGPPFADDGTSAYYLCCNRNKLSVALDLDSVGDRDVLHRLMEGADVVLENFRRGALAARGIQVQEVLRRHERLIWCTLSGFGPDSARPGYDFVVQGECGWMAITGEPDGEPMKTGVALADVNAGKDAAIAILGALLSRDRSVEPLAVEDRLVHVSLAHSATAALINVAQNAMVSRAEARRWGNAHANLVPYQLFQAADRPIVIAVGNDGQWRAACHALGLEALGADPGLATNAGRVAQRERVVRAIADRVATADAERWLGTLASAGVPSGRVRSVREALADVTADARLGVAPAVGAIRLPPPRLDEHGPLVRAQGWEAFRSIGT